MDLVSPDRSAPRRPSRRGYTVVELLIAIVIVGVLARLGGSGIRALRNQQSPERVARSVLWELSVARSFALRAGEPVSLVADKTNRRLITRNSYGEVYRTAAYGTGTDLVATSFSTNLTGDSLVFSPRGYCLNCAAAGSSAVTVVAQGRTYSMTINRLGRVQLTGQPAN